MNLYDQPFIIALCVTGFLLILSFVFRKKLLSLNSPQEERHIGDKHALRIGGIALTTGFIIALLVDKNLELDERSFFFLGALGILVLVGFIDDMRSISWKMQLIAQLLFAITLYSVGVHIGFISTPFGVVHFDVGILTGLGFIISTVWIMGVINVINWIDGIDGLAGGVSVIAGVTLFILTLTADVYQPPLAIMLAAFVGALSIFTVINIMTGRIFAGTSGSYFMGATIAVLAIFAGAKIGTALLVLIVPIADAISVLYDRIKNKKSIFTPDMRHLHHRLLARGWSKEKILLWYYGLTILGACAALLSRSFDKFILFLLYGSILLFVFMFVMQKQKTSEV